MSYLGMGAEEVEEEEEEEEWGYGPVEGSAGGQHPHMERGPGPSRYTEGRAGLDHGEWPSLENWLS